MIWAVGFIGVIMGTLVIGIYRYCPWLLVILGGFWIVIGLVSLIKLLHDKSTRTPRTDPHLSEPLAL